MARFTLIIAAFGSMAITALSGFFILPWLKKLHYGQTIKEIGPTWHNKKQGTPMMGGLMFILGSLCATVLGYAVLMINQPELAVAGHLRSIVGLVTAMLTTAAFCMVGFIDDYLKVVHKQNLGLTARYKIVMQVAITTLYLVSLQLQGNLSTAVSLPVFGVVEFGFAFYPLAYLLIIGMVNAVNLTDGLDGLASSVTFVVMIGFMVAATLIGYYTLGIYAAALAGGCAGFLCWNFYPAKCFMGDTGSMYLGGAVTTIAFGLGRPELLFLFGIVYICEAASVVIQVTYFKLTHGKRIFKMTPIHHHFEMCGWSEVKIVGAFSFVALIGVVLGFVYLYLV